MKVFFSYLETAGGKDIGELSFDDFGDIPLYSDFIINLRKKKHHTYPGEQRGKCWITLIPYFLIREIDHYVEPYVHGSSGTLFLSLRSNEGLTKNSIKRLFTKLKKETGISWLRAAASLYYQSPETK